MSTGALAWRHYRLERKMFWRNPTAAFFSFVLPLIFLGSALPLTVGKLHAAGNVLLRMATFRPWFRKDARLAHTYREWEMHAFSPETAPVYVLMMREPLNWMASVHRLGETGQWPQLRAPSCFSRLQALAQP